MEDIPGNRHRAMYPTATLHRKTNIQRRTALFVVFQIILPVHNVRYTSPLSGGTDAGKPKVSPRPGGGRCPRRCPLNSLGTSLDNLFHRGLTALPRIFPCGALKARQAILGTCNRYRQRATNRKHSSACQICSPISSTRVLTILEK